jgi:hypothetical protein
MKSHTFGILSLPCSSKFKVISPSLLTPVFLSILYTWCRVSTQLASRLVQTPLASAFLPILLTLCLVSTQLASRLVQTMSRTQTTNPGPQAMHFAQIKDPFPSLIFNCRSIRLSHFFHSFKRQILSLVTRVPIYKTTSCPPSTAPRSQSHSIARSMIVLFLIITQISCAVGQSVSQAYTLKRLHHSNVISPRSSRGHQRIINKNFDAETEKNTTPLISKMLNHRPST